MFECIDCGRTFLEPETVCEDIGFDTEIGHRTIYERYDICPYCGGDVAETEVLDDAEL